MTPRLEHDALGGRPVPADALWGIHTARAMENFPLTGRPVRPPLIRALARVKQACARANAELGWLTPDVAAALDAACDDVARGGHGDQFPVDALQGGAGTSLNMNMNEVLANLTLERLGLPRGAYDRVHPIDTVNLHQSTNDVIPTALRVAAIEGARALAEAWARAQGAFQRQERACADILLLGRTEGQPAVPLTLGAALSGAGEALARDRWRAFKAEERLRTVNLGGTAVGTGLTAPRAYIFRAVDRLRELTGLPLSRAENLVDATANADAFVEASGMFDAGAVNLLKIAGDLRAWHGAGELCLQPVQAGSSIMPGKVNPVLLEAVMQVALRARANHGLIAEAAARGSLQINEFLPLLADALLETLALLAAAAGRLAVAAETLAPDAAVCEAHAVRSPALVTALLPDIGYERAGALAAEFAASGEPDLRAFLAARLGADLVNRRLSPEGLTALGHDLPPPSRSGEGAA
jgi:aspartate ammonia-lyase